MCSGAVSNNCIFIEFRDIDSCHQHSMSDVLRPLFLLNLSLSSLSILLPSTLQHWPLTLTLTKLSWSCPCPTCHFFYFSTLFTLILLHHPILCKDTSIDCIRYHKNKSKIKVIFTVPCIKVWDEFSIIILVCLVRNA